MATLFQLQEGLVKAQEQGDDEGFNAISDAIREHPTYQKQGQKSLSRGFKGLDGDERKRAIHQSTAQSLGIKPSELDSEQGMGGWGRFKLGLLRDEQSKVDNLEKNYGRENLRSVDIGGEQQVLYRDKSETNNKWRRVDEQGFSLADISDMSGAIVPIAGAIAGTAAVAATGGTALIPLALGAAGGSFLAGTAQDVTTELATGQDVDVGNIIGNQAKMSAIGLPIDVFTGGASRFLGKAFSKRASLKAIDELVESTDSLNQTYKTNIKLTAAQSSDPDASIKQGMRAGLDPRGREAAWYNDQLDDIGKINNAVKTGLASDEPIESVMSRMGEKHLAKLENYKAEIQRLDDLAASEKALKPKQTKEFSRAEREKLTRLRELEHQGRVAAYEKSFAKMQKNVEKLETLRGGQIQRQVEEGYKAKRKEVDKLYSSAERIMKAPIYKIRDKHSLAPVAKAFERVMRKYNIADPTKEYSYKTLEARLGKSIADDLFTLHQDLAAGRTVNFSKLNSMTRRLESKVVRKTAGSTDDQLIISDLAKSMLRIRKQALKDIGPTASEAWKKANKEYRKKILPYTEGEAAQLMSKRAGGLSGSTQGGDRVMNTVLKDATSIRNALDAGADRQTLKNAYMNRILDAAEGGKPVRFDKGILDNLYSTTSGRATAQIANIKRLNTLLENSKINPKAVTKDDIFEMIDAFDAKAKARAEKILVEKSAQQVKLDEANKNVLMKVINKEQPAPEDIHIFIDDIAKLKPGQIKALRKQLSKPEQDSLTRSGLDWFLEKAGASKDGVQRTSAQTGGEALWDADTMHKLLNNRVQRSKIEMLLGEDTGKQIIRDYERMNKVLGTASILRSSSEGAGSRVVLTTGATGMPSPLIVSPGIPRAIGRKMLGIIHTSPIGRSMLRRWLQEPDKKAAEELFKKIFAASIATRSGMASLANESSKDAEFSEWVQNEMSSNENSEAPQASQQP